MAEVQILLASGELGFSSVKPEQMNVVKGILRKDVFAILPTGFGKSACFQCLPILLGIYRSRLRAFVIGEAHTVKKC